ncbi:HAD family hydrolase [Hominifimenecus microfluidus]|uniref:HAD family hydrolase n=1 Tax=Hominifimenecus microfluidus TaxID=2885348 RepID=UPI0032C11E3F
MIRNVFLDLDNTLFDFTKAEHIALARTLRLLDVDPAEATLCRYSELNLEQWKLLELGKITREQVKVRRFENLFRELGTAASPEQAAALYETFLGEGHYYIDGAEDLLKALYGRYRLYLASNGTLSVQQSRLASAGIAGLFDGIFLSEVIGADKPSKEFFAACFSQIPDFRKEEDRDRGRQPDFGYPGRKECWNRNRLVSALSGDTGGGNPPGRSDPKAFRSARAPSDIIEGKEYVRSIEL